jgi:hypothetical protein
MMIVRLLPFVLAAVILGLIIARALRGAAVPGAAPRFALPKITLPKKKRHLRLVNKDAMDRELNELLKRK